MEAFRWAFQPSNALAVAGWGFWFGLVGLVLTVIGFALTWRQLSQTKTIAEATREESRRLKLALRNYDAANEMSKASYALNSAKRHFKNRAWADGAESYEDVKKSLSSLVDNVPALGDDIIDDVEKAKSYISNLCLRVDKHQHSGGAEVDYVKVRSVMRDHENLIVRISSIVQKGFIDGND